jgi:hypothetical protein
MPPEVVSVQTPTTVVNGANRRCVLFPAGRAPTRRVKNAIQAVYRDYLGSSVGLPAERVFVCSRIEGEKRRTVRVIGGTYGVERGIPWVAVVDDRRVVPVLHHELSSHLLRLGVVDAEAWAALRGPVPASLAEEADRRPPHTTTEALLTAGFVNWYSVTNAEDDFNEVVEAVYRDYTLHDWLPAHPLLLAKVRFVVATYCSLGIVVPDFVQRVLHRPD